MKGQNPYYDRRYEDLLRTKVEKILPEEEKDTSSKKIVIFNPIVEYRYYGTEKIPLNILDSSFASKSATFQGSYCVFPNKAKLAQSIFALSINKPLSRHRDTSIVSFREDLIVPIKMYLDSIVNRSNTIFIKSIQSSASLLPQFNNLNFDHAVVTNILIYQSPLHPPNLFIRFSFFVFDIRKKKDILL